MKNYDRAYNLIITGVGGQGNVLSSLLIGQTLVRRGYFVTIGETYGMAQRGGPVMSHIRFSSKSQPSPLIPKGTADTVMSLEPIEALRVLINYGNPKVMVLANLRPVYSVDVTGGDSIYPTSSEIKEALKRLSGKVCFLDATEKAIQLGSPILVNMIMIGALIESKVLPLTEKDFIETLSDKFSNEKLKYNIKALAEGKRVFN